MLIPWLVFLSFFSLYPSPPFAHLSPTSQLLCNNGNIVDGCANSVNTCSLFVSTKYWLPAPCRKCIIHLHAIVIYSSENWPLKQFLNLFFFWQSPSLLIHKMYNCCRGICWAVGFFIIFNRIFTNGFKISTKIDICMYYSLYFSFVISNKWIDRDVIHKPVQYEIPILNLHGLQLNTRDIPR